MFGGLFDPKVKMAKKLIKEANKTITLMTRMISDQKTSADDREIISSHLNDRRKQIEMWSKVIDRKSTENLYKEFFNENTENYSLIAMNKEVERFSKTPAIFANYLRQIKSS